MPETRNLTQLILTDDQAKVLAAMIAAAHTYRCRGVIEQLESTDRLDRIPTNYIHEVVDLTAKMLDTLIHRGNS
jgi:hypothetical protein